MGQQPLAEDIAVDIVLNGASDLETVGTGQPLFREGPVHLSGVQQEGDVLYTEVEDLPHIQMIVESGLVRCRLLSGCCGSLSRRRRHIVLKDLGVLGHEYYRIVVILNDGLRAVLRCLHRSIEAFGVDVEFLGRIG